MDITNQSRGRTGMGEDHGGAVADFVHKSRGEEIHQQLHCKIRDKIVDDCLYDISRKAGINGFFVLRFHRVLLYNVVNAKKKQAARSDICFLRVSYYSTGDFKGKDTIQIHNL